MERKAETGSGGGAPGSGGSRPAPNGSPAWTRDGRALVDPPGAEDRAGAGGAATRTGDPGIH